MLGLLPEFPPVGGRAQSRGRFTPVRPFRTDRQPRRHTGCNVGKALNRRAMLDVPTEDDCLKATAGRAVG